VFSVPRWGARGAVVAYAISELLTGVLPLYAIVRRHTGFRFGWSWLRMTPAVVVSVAICQLTGTRGTFTGAVGSAVMFTILLLACGGVPTEDLRLVADGFRRRIAAQPDVVEAL